MNQNAALDSAHLKMKHLKAVEEQKTWIEIWELIYCDPWFQSRLEMLIAKIIRKNQLPRHWKDDIYQEAMIVFAQSLRRRPGLGFDPQRGKYESLLVTVLNRCCQKGLRQFRNTLVQRNLDPEIQPCIDRVMSAEKLFEYRELMELIPEPARSILLAICHGESVEAMANRLDCSSRTIYRHLENAKAIILEYLER